MPGAHTTPVADATPQIDDSKRASYAKVTADLASFFSAEATSGGTVLSGVPWAGIDTVGRMSLLCAFLARAFPSWHFVGFYVVGRKRECTTDDAESEELNIGPYQGDVLATARIPFGKGQCGACAAERVTMIAADVSVCANYIPCDDVTRSEIVVPVWGRNGHNEPEENRPEAPRRLIAVLDVDSPVLENFNAVDKENLELLLAKYF